jgi:hypothetical protein
MFTLPIDETIMVFLAYLNAPPLSPTFRSLGPVVDELLAEGGEWGEAIFEAAGDAVFGAEVA